MPKQVIDLSRDARQRRHTFLSYGGSRSGKTRFAATFPRPLFLSDRSERGYETLRYMPDDAFYEPGVRPTVWSVGAASEMVDAVQDAEAEIRQQPDRYSTLVIDSLTFYADSYFSALEMSAINAGKIPDSRKLYGMLQSHIQWLMIRVHEMPLNVVWICLDKPPGEDNGTEGGVMLAGMTAKKVPARCDYWLYHRVYQAGPTIAYEIRTRRFGYYMAGGRDGGLLPDPITDCRYKMIEEALGLPPAFEMQPEAPPAGRRVFVAAGSQKSR